MILHQFNFLTPAELIILERHLDLGLTHLEHHLSKDELEQLLESLTLDDAQIAKIGQSNTEISGSLSLALNTIFTATFGAWMGYFGFWEFSLASIWIFGSIITVAAGIGAFIGYEAILSKKQQTRDAIKNQILHLFQIEILRKIEQKRKEEVFTICQGFNEIFLNLSKNTSFEKKISILNLAENAKSGIPEWIEEVENMEKEKLEACFNGVIPKECEEEWREIHKELRHNLICFAEEKGVLETIRSKSQKKKRKPLDSSLEKLISTYPKKSSTPSPSWSRTNARSLILGLTPTLLGGFSSLTVYLGGIPAVLKNFGHEKLFNFFTNPEVKIVEFTISILLTLYFGFSFAYENRKKFNRNQELEKTRKNIVQRESALTLLDVDLIRLKEVKKSALQLMRFFNTVEALSDITTVKNS